jgi:hypothetical protein
MLLIRDYAGVKAWGDEAQQAMERASQGEARTLEDLPDIINVALEQLVRQRFELPAFSTLQFTRGIVGSLPSSHPDSSPLVSLRPNGSSCVRHWISSTRSRWKEPQPRVVSTRFHKMSSGLQWRCDSSHPGASCDLLR